jgi:hypothetical protein
MANGLLQRAAPLEAGASSAPGAAAAPEAQAE